MGRWDGSVVERRRVRTVRVVWRRHVGKEDLGGFECAGLGQ